MPPAPPDLGAAIDLGATQDLGAPDVGPEDLGTLDLGPMGPVPPTMQELEAARWEEMPTAPSINGKQDDVYFIDPLQGWSVNGLGRIYKTTDGGDNWTLVFEQPGTYFRAILFVDEMRGFAGNLGTGLSGAITDSTPLYRTVDGGETWTAVTEIQGPTPVGICNMTRKDNTILASGRVAGPSFLMRSDDLGQTWTSTELTGQIAMLIDAALFSPTEGIIVGGSSSNPNFSQTVVLRTEDSGATWTNVYTSSTTQELAWKIDFPSADTGFVSVQSSGAHSALLKTQDQGRSWTVLPFIDGPYNAKGVGFVNEQVGWVAGEVPGTPAYKTLDGGETWSVDNSLGPLVNRFRFLREGRLGFAIGQRIQRLVIPD